MLNRTQILVLSALPLLVALAPAQYDDTYIGKVAVPFNLAAEPLKEADKALERKDLLLVLKIYEDLLERHWDKPFRDFSAPRQGDETNPVIAGDRFRGTREEVFRRILALPEAQRDAYLKHAEEKARLLLREGLAARRDRDLREAASRYFLSESGRAAALALVDHYLERGSVDEARMATQFFRGMSERLSVGRPELFAAREAVSLHALNDAKGLARLARRFADVGDALAISGERQLLRDVIDTLIKTLPEQATAATFDADLDVFSRRAWDYPFRQRGTQVGDFVSWGAVRVRPKRQHYPVLPAIRDGALYVNDGLGITARSLFNGQLLWPEVHGPRSHFEGRPNRSLTFEVTVTDDMVIGYLEGAPTTRASSSPWGSYEPIEPIPTRKLVAVDRTSGREVWNHHRFKGQTPEETTFVRKLTVNTPPLVIGDTLYVAASYYHGGFRQWLCAFERATGNLVWSTYVCTGQMELNMFGNPIKEAVPGYVTEQDGVLYYCTNVGIMAAVDAGTGGIRWLSAYDQVPIPHTQSQLTRERLPGWMPSRPVVYDDRVFVAPSDSYELYAMDIETGAAARVMAATRTFANRNAYFLGVHEDTLLVAGKNIVGIDPKTLRHRWSSIDLPSNATGDGFVKGLPAVLGSTLIFLTSGQRGVVAYALDVRTGKFFDRDAVLPGRSQEGHLVLSDEAALVAGVAQINVFFNLEQIERRLRADAVRNPEDVDVQLRLAEVRRQKGEWSSAIGSYERALELATAKGRAGHENAERARAALHGTWLELARRPTVNVATGPSTVEARFEKALDYADDEGRRVRTLMLALSWARDQKKREYFVATAKRIVEDHPEVEVVLEGETLDLLRAAGTGRRLPAGVVACLAAGIQLQDWGRHRDAVAFFQLALNRFPRVPIDTRTTWEFCSERIVQSIADAGHQAVYADQEREARTLLDKGREEGDSNALQSILSYYPQSTLVEEAYLELTKQLISSEKYTDALIGVQRYLGRFKNVTAPVLSQYVRCLEALGCMDSAEQLLSVIETRFPSHLLEDGDGRSPGKAWVAKRRKSPAYAVLEASRAASLEIPKVGVNLKPGWQFTPKAGELRMVIPEGRVPESATRLVLAYADGQLFALDPTGKKVAWTQACGPYPRRAFWHDGYLAILGDEEGIVFDPEGVETWRYRASDANIEDMGVGQGRVYFLLHEIFGGKRLSLRGLDILTGQEVQERDLDGFAEGRLQVGEGHLLVYSRGSARAIALSALTGARIGPSFSIPRSTAIPVPYIAKGDLLIKSADQLSVQANTTQLLAIDLNSEKQVWEYSIKNEDVHNGWADPENLVLSLRKRGGGSDGNGKRLLVLDTAAGRKRFSHELDKRERAADVLIVGNDCLIAIEKSSIYRDQTERYARLVNARSGNTRWDSLPFVGSNVLVEFALTQDYVLLRKSAPGSESGGAGVFFLDRTTGKALDEIPLGNAPPLRNGEGPGLLLRKDGVLILGESGLTLYQP